MSLTGHLLHRAAAKAAEQAARRLKIDQRMASKLAPVAVAIILSGFRRNTATLVGAAVFGFALDRYQEDLLKNAGRLGDADVRARGEAIIDKALGKNAQRAARVLADLSGIDLARATALLAMTAPAVVSALAKARRDLKLTPTEMGGVVKSEAARVDGADPALTRDILEWVFRPPFLVRAVRGLRERFGKSGASARPLTA